MSAADFQPLIDWLSQHPGWLLFSVFLISFIESLALAGIIVPGVLLLFLVASLAGHLDFAISSLLLAGFLGAILGDGISFYLGRYFKDSIPGIWPFSRYPDTLRMGHVFFEKHGGKSVVLGRFIGPIRPILPLIAGMLNMSQKKFAIYNGASALAWAPFYLLPGYLAGKATHIDFPEHGFVLLIGLVSLIILFALAFRTLSLKLQVNSSLYDALLLKRETSSSFQALHRHYQHYLQQHPGFEFPLASAALLLLNLLFFSVWSLLTNATELLSPINDLSLNLAQSLRTDFGSLSTAFNQLQIHLTLLGDEAFLYLSFTIVVILMLIRKHYYAAGHLILAGLITAVVTHSLKLYFAIERPDITLEAPHSFAYPSGHSSGATVFYGMIASFIAQEMHPKQRWKCYMSFGSPILLIAFSRVFLGVHWLTDVIGGIALGLIITGLTRVSYGYFWIKDKKLENTNHTDKRMLILVTSIWIIAAACYQFAALEDAQTALSLKLN